ncbi:MAG: acyl-CoA thioesterase [Planctomycetia bacterium]|nr:acyl-CoA thioesterase [Planctomycetia bacterium]
MPAIYSHRLTVQPDEIDRLGHANNLVYLRWMLDAAVAHSTAQSWDSKAYEELGAVFVVRSHQIEYLRPAFAAEEVVVLTWVASFRRASSVRRYEMRRASDGKVLATAATEWAFVDLATRLPTRIHPRVLAAFEVAPDGPPEAT